MLPDEAEEKIEAPTEANIPISQAIYRGPKYKIQCNYKGRSTYKAPMTPVDYVNIENEKENARKNKR